MLYHNSSKHNFSHFSDLGQHLNKIFMVMYYTLMWVIPCHAPFLSTSWWHVRYVRCLAIRLPPIRPQVLPSDYMFVIQ